MKRKNPPFFCIFFWPPGPVGDPRRAQNGAPMQNARPAKGRAGEIRWDQPISLVMVGMRPWTRMTRIRMGSTNWK